MNWFGFLVMAIGLMIVSSGINGSNGKTFLGGLITIGIGMLTFL